ncbi:MAG: diguanylate cyclase [Herminiimonas sp.]|nr:diguanylate cyclase [Herminiimonas sp.]
MPGLVYQCRLAPDGSVSFLYASDGIGEIYELTPSDVAHDSAPIHARIHAEDRAAYQISLQESAEHLTPWHLEFRVILPRQGLRWRHANARPSRSADGGTVWHGMITDITERKYNEIELQEFAAIDFLTQLPNRRHFMAKMDKELQRVQRSLVPATAVLMCDLDHSKAINDCYGHAAGDLVLKGFATILRGQLRKHDTVGRVGGEEFAVVLPGANVAEACHFAERVQRELTNTRLIDSIGINPVTVSIGIAKLSQGDARADTALARSDIAPYRAKDGGRNRIEVLVE